MSDDNTLLLSVYPTQGQSPVGGSGSTPKVTATVIGGWLSSDVTLTAEGVPNRFEVAATERFKSADFNKFILQPTNKFDLSIGDDVVVTGYVDSFVPSISGLEHTIAISGRGKCQDLIDCSAEWPGGQLSGYNVLDIATKLAAPYGVSVSCNVANLPIIPQLNIMVAETPFDIIERCCRYSQLIAYEQPDGSLILTQVGTNTTATVLKQGFNIQEGSVAYTATERYSEYDGYLLALNIFGDLGDASFVNDRQIDTTFPRNRKKSIVAESVGGSLAPGLLHNRLIWEMNRRNGRSREAIIVTDSWRDQQGKLWLPNTQIDIQAPALKIDTIAENAGKWIIGSVTYHKGEDGTRAIITAMPKLAFIPEPIQLQPIYPDVTPDQIPAGAQ